MIYAKDLLGQVRLALFGAIGCACIASGASPAQSAEPKWNAHLDITGVVGDRDRGETDLFVPIAQDETSMLFVDLRGKLFSGGEVEGNFGLGYRHMLSGGWNLGGYAFYDLRRSEHDNTFRQITLGGEALSVDWDLRANVYVPLNDTETVSSMGAIGPSEVVTRGNSVELRTPMGEREEVALYGFDAEVGRRIPVFEEGDDRQFRGFLGGYYFNHADVDDPVAGPRLRLEYRVHDVLGIGPGSRLTFEGQGQWDDPRGFQGFVGATLRIPLQSFEPTRRRSRLSVIERRMTDSIVRDVDIVTQSVTRPRGEIAEAARIAETGVEVAGVRRAGADDDLSDVVENEANPNEIVIVNGNVSDTTVTMQDGQALVGGGTRVTLVGVESGRRLAWKASGAAGAIDMNDKDINVPSNALVAGLTIDNADEAIDLDRGASNVSLRDLVITDPKDDGIEMVRNEDVRISNVVIDGAGRRGIEMRRSTGVTITDVTIRNTRRLEGLKSIRDTDVTVRNLTVTDSVRDDAIEFDRITGLDMTGVTVDGADFDGLDIDRGSDISVRELTVRNVDDNGVEIRRVDGFALDTATVTGIRRDGVQVNAGRQTSSDVSFDNVTLDGIGRHGFRLRGTIDGLTGANNTVADQGRQVCNSRATVTGGSLEVQGAPCP